LDENEDKRRDGLLGLFAIHYWRGIIIRSSAIGCVESIISRLFDFSFEKSNIQQVLFTNESIVN
jgi:hypothetical protein